MPRTLPTLTVALLAASLLPLWGCTRAENERLRLGNDHVISAFRTHTHELPPAGPSLTGLDRSNWEPVIFKVPVMGTAHQPKYSPMHNQLDALARQRGDYPTAESALELGHPDVGDELYETGRAHGWAFLDALLIAPRLIYRPPNATDWSPMLDYERARDEVTADIAPCCEGGCDACNASLREQP